MNTKWQYAIEVIDFIEVDGIEGLCSIEAVRRSISTESLR